VTFGIRVRLVILEHLAEGVAEKLTIDSTETAK
jgi:hypothetical protein